MHRHPERSRGIPMRYLKPFTTGSLPYVRDDRVGGRIRKAGIAGADLEGHLWTIGTYDPWKKD
jgi:hypothetical protein